MRKSVDDTAVHTAKAGLLDYAKGKLSFDQEMLFPGVKPLADPKGKAIFDAKFIPKFEAAYDAWVKDGKNPWEFLTQENVDKLMQGMRSKTEMAMDKISARDDATGEKTEQAVPPPPADIPAPAWQEVMAERPIAPSRAPGRAAELGGRHRAGARQSDAGKYRGLQQDFKDFDAKKILDKLGTRQQGNVDCAEDGSYPGGTAAPATCACNRAARGSFAHGRCVKGGASGAARSSSRGCRKCGLLRWRAYARGRSAI